MKESYGEGIASHTGPESCAAVREALTGERAGRVFSRESELLRDADAVGEGGRPHPGRRHRKTPRSPARSETPGMHGHISRENRESPGLPVVDGAAGRVGKSTDARR
jgi:RNA-directed DNA polymerase